MNWKRILTACFVSAVGCSTCGVFADSKYQVHFSELQSDWIASGVPIQDLREHSTQLFQLLDENQSGSITLDEVDLAQPETELEQMSPVELRQYRQRNSVIQNKLMSWSVEFSEFEVVDTNNDGVWTQQEYELRQEKLHRHRLELGFQEWDSDGNQAIELNEFNSHLDELELLDENADGTVSHKEAFKSKNDKVISDVLLNKLQLDGAIWTSTSIKQAATDLEAEVAATRYRFVKKQKTVDPNK